MSNSECASDVVYCGVVGDGYDVLESARALVVGFEVAERGSRDTAPFDTRVIDAELCGVSSVPAVYGMMVDGYFMSDLVEKVRESFAATGPFGSPNAENVSAVTVRVESSGTDCIPTV